MTETAAFRPGLWYPLMWLIVVLTCAVGFDPQGDGAFASRCHYNDWTNTNYCDYFMTHKLTRRIAYDIGNIAALAAMGVGFAAACARWIPFPQVKAICVIVGIVLAIVSGAAWYIQNILQGNDQGNGVMVHMDWFLGFIPDWFTVRPR